MFRTTLLLLIVAACFATGLRAQSQTISYEWLNVPCFSNINCNTGCSACNVPDNSSSAFFGTNMIWPGLTLCPHPISPANNAVHSEGWTSFASNTTFAMFSGMSTIPMQVDSVIIRHRNSSDGPQRLRISFTTDLSQPHVEVDDVEVTSEWSETVLTDLGRMEIGNGQDFGTLQLKLQAYQGQGGAWQIDMLRVVGSPATQLVTGIAVLDNRYEHLEGQLTDVLGRPVGNDPAPGMYIGTQRVVRVN